GKTDGPADAVAMLRRLAGRMHVVRTEVALVNGAGRALHFGVRSAVTMKPFDVPAVRAYVASGAPLDRAGAYAIPRRGGVLGASGSGRVCTRLPQVSSNHCASAANRAGILRSSASVAGYVSSKMTNEPPGLSARATDANAAALSFGSISWMTRKLVATS